MLPYATLIAVDRNGPTPIYQQVAHRLIALIREGRIAPGAYLPGTREMSQLLGLHRKTVVAAYEELQRQDWIDTVPRKGFIVSPQLPALKPRSFRPEEQVQGFAKGTAFAFQTPLALPPTFRPQARHRWIINDGFPDSRLSPLDALLKECRRLAAGPVRDMAYGGGEGQEPLREALAEHLAGTRGLPIGPGNLLVSRGAQMAIYVVAALLLRPGDKVIVGETNYRYADLCFESLGATLLRAPVDEQGMDVEAVRRLCRSHNVRLLYIIPHHHHPTTVTLSAERRMQLLEFVRDQSLPVLEDDYDYDFHYSSGPILPLASADHRGNVMYVGSLTKTLGLTVRVGFLVGTPDLVRAATDLRRLMDLRGDNLMENGLAGLIRNGEIQRHLKKTAKRYKERRDLLCGLMERELGESVRFRVPDGGMAVWTTLAPGLSLPKIAAKADQLGLLMSDGSQYGGLGSAGIRIGFASLDEGEIPEVVRVLKAAIGNARA